MGSGLVTHPLQPARSTAVELAESLPGLFPGLAGAPNKSSLAFVFPLGRAQSTLGAVEFLSDLDDSLLKMLQFGCEPGILGGGLGLVGGAGR